MKVNRKYLKESLKEGMSRLEIMKYNKALYSRLEKSLNNLPDGLKKYVIKYYGLPWCKNNNWLGGMSDSASNKAIYKILSLGDYTEDEIMDEIDNFIDCFISDNSNKSEDEKLKLYLNESLNEDLFDVPRDLADSICKYLDSKNFHNYELVDYDSYPMNTSKITFEVDGDWKHDHLYFKDLVYDWSFDNNKSIYKIESELVRDDGSDDYASDYFIYVTENEDSLKELKSMSKLFSEDYEEESLSEGLDPWYGKYVPMGIGGSKGEPRKVYFYFDSTDFEEAEEEFFDIIPEPYLKAKLYGRASEGSLVKDGWKNINESLNEASYGGAFDIEDDQFFTRDDINEFAWEVADSLSSEFGKTFDVADSYMETPKRLHLEVTDGDYDYFANIDINMRRIRSHRDLMKYFNDAIDQIKSQMDEY